LQHITTNPTWERINNQQNYTKKIPKTDELQNCFHQEVENYYEHSFSSFFWVQNFAKILKTFWGCDLCQGCFWNVFCKSLF
jgi:hypothetical protein